MPPLSEESSHADSVGDVKRNHSFVAPRKKQRAKTRRSDNEACKRRGHPKKATKSEKTKKTTIRFNLEANTVFRLAPKHVVSSSHYGLEDYAMMRLDTQRLGIKLDNDTEELSFGLHHRAPSGRDQYMFRKKHARVTVLRMQDKLEQEEEVSINDKAFLISQAYMAASASSRRSAIGRAHQQRNAVTREKSPDLTSTVALLTDIGSNTRKTRKRGYSIVSCRHLSEKKQDQQLKHRD